LDQALQTCFISIDIDINTFQDIVGHLSSPQDVKFSEKFLPPIPNHNHALHIEFYMRKHNAKQVLINGRENVNIHLLSFVK